MWVSMATGKPQISVLNTVQFPDWSNRSNYMMYHKNMNLSQTTKIGYYWLPQNLKKSTDP